MEWSDRNFLRNIKRLYLEPITSYRAEAGDYASSFNAVKVGDPSFHVIIARDLNPVYGIVRTVSGKYCFANLSTHEVKKSLRKLSKKEYQVHASNDILEFHQQASILLPLPLYENVLSNEFCKRSEAIHHDLNGANGWENLDVFFKVINSAQRYLVLRDFQSIGESFDQSDIDILCEDFQSFASTANLLQKRNTLYKGRTEISGSTVFFDVRYVGDDYYDPGWSKNMLEKRVKFNQVYAPHPVDHYFSLIYHAYLQKPKVSLKHEKTLTRIEEENRLPKEIVPDNVSIYRLKRLGRFMIDNHYFYRKPTDPLVFENFKALRYLPVKLSNPISKEKKPSIIVLRGLGNNSSASDKQRHQKEDKIVKLWTPTHTVIQVSFSSVQQCGRNETARKENRNTINRRVTVREKTKNFFLVEGPWRLLTDVKLKYLLTRIADQTSTTTIAIASGTEVDRINSVGCALENTFEIVWVDVTPPTSPSPN
jgi:hypothetical protein